MAAAVLVDAGALIALLDRSDSHHAAAVAALESLHDRLTTVWPALTEAMHLLSGVRGAHAALLGMVEDEAVELAEIGREDFDRIRALMHQYADLPMDFADAVLVRVAERDGLRRILTFDAHFRVYRLPRKAKFVVL